MVIDKSHKSWRRISGTTILHLFFIAVAGIVLVIGGCARITKGPVLLRIYGNRASLMWETDVEEIGKVRYGLGEKFEQYAVVEPHVMKYKQGGEQKTAFIYKVWLENLKPGRVYKYRIGGHRILDKVYKFRTKSDEMERVRFAVYGDSRDDPMIHRKIVRLIKDKDVDFVIHSGDLVNDGGDYRQWGPQFFEPIKGLTENIPIYIAKGNHEGNSGIYEKLLIPQGEKNSFSFDYGPVHFFCADNVSKGLKDKDVLQEIIDDATDSKAQWKFVSYHIPSLNFGGHWSAWGYPDALASFSKAGIDFVVTGHSHQYERFWPIAPADGNDNSYVTYITSGGGGGPLHSINALDYHACAQKINHFCIFDIQGEKLSMEAIGLDGQVIDHLEITKTNGRLNKEYIDKAIPMERVSAEQAANRHREH